MCVYEIVVARPCIKVHCRKLATPADRGQRTPQAPAPAGHPHAIGGTQGARYGVLGVQGTMRTMTSLPLQKIARRSAGLRAGRPPRHRAGNRPRGPPLGTGCKKELGRTVWGLGRAGDDAGITTPHKWRTTTEERGSLG